MLTAKDLSYMRDVVNGLLPQRCNILEASLASDGQGGQVVTWGTATANVPCRLDPGTRLSDETLQTATLLPYAHAILTLLQGTEITTENRVEIGDYVYTVQSVDAGKAWEITRRAGVMLL